jgi:predicted nucleic-acid-binding Zn-ribbon protein
MEEKTCPKCGSRTRSDKIFGSGAVETSLFKDGEFRGDDIKAYYCRRSGFIELYRTGNKRFPAVTTERELEEYSEMKTSG